MSDQENQESFQKVLDKTVGIVTKPDVVVIAKTDTPFSKKELKRELTASNGAKVVPSTVTNPGEAPKFPGLTAYGSQGQKIENLDPEIKNNKIDYTE